MMNYNELTVVVLKEQAKALGINGAYKMKKDELIEALNNIELKGEDTMENSVVNNGVENKEEVKEVENMNGLNVVEIMELVAGDITNGYRRVVTQNVIADLNDGINVDVEEVKIAAAYLRGAKTVNVLDMHDVANFVDKGLNEEAIDTLCDLISVTSAQTFKMEKDFKAMKKWSKELRVILQRQLEVDRVKRGSSKVKSSIRLMASQESDVLRAIGFEETKMADTGYATVRLGTNELLTLKLGNGLIGDEDGLPALDSVFNKIASIGEQGIYVIISKNGVGQASWYAPSKGKMKEGDIAYKYEFLDMTASGGRTGSLTLAAVKRYSKVNGKITSVNCDKREAILNASTYNGWKLTFKEASGEGLVEKFKEYTQTQVFKNLNREANGNAPSKIGFGVKYAFVFDNIGAYSMYNVANPSISAHNNAKAMELFTNFLKSSNKDEKKELVDELNRMGICLVPDTRDGNVFGNAETMTEFYNEEGLPVNYYSVAGTTNQSRGIGTLKSSITFLRTEDLRLIAEYNLAIGNTVDYVIYEGKKMSFNDLTDDMLQELLDNLQIAADRNAIKLGEHADDTKIVFLKMAYESDTKLSQILNIAMAHSDMKRTKALLEKKMVEVFANAFSKVGVSFEIDNGKITNSVFSLDAIKRMNNSTQIMEYLFSNDPERILAAFPYAVRHILANDIKSIANRITALDLPTDARYSVIQSDLAVIYGFRILNDNEVYLADQTITAKRVSAIRQPMSGLIAVSTFNVVKLREIISRINNLETSTEIKNALLNYYRDAKGFNIIPASHYLMEKHDGMDFDIDAMMFYFEEEVVDILSNIKEQGVKIERNEDDYRETLEETCIKAWQQEEVEYLQAPSQEGEIEYAINTDIAENSRESIASSIMAGAIADAKAKSVRKITMNFNDKLEVIRTFFKNPVADVGVITSDFYNNAIALIELLKGGENAEAICEALRTSYNCEKQEDESSSYISPINSDVKEVIVTKSICTSMIYRFKASAGTLQDCIYFIADCCLANRYPAESSIDVVKNGYFMLNYFAHRTMFSCLGLDKHMTFFTVPCIDVAVKSLPEVSFNSHLDGIEESAELFNSRIYNNARTALGLESKESLFKLPMIADLRKCKGAVIIDQIAELKLGLMDVANMLIVLVENELERYVTSPTAAAIRQDIVDQYNENSKLYENNNLNMKSIIISIENAYNRLSSSLKEQDLGDAYDTMISKEYIESFGIASIRNFAEIAFNGLSKADIGVMITNYYIEQLMMSIANGKISTINPGVIKVLEEEFIIGLGELGFDNMGIIAETVDCVITDKAIKSAKFALDQYVEISGGSGYVTLEDGSTIKVKTTEKKASIAGYVEQDENRVVIVAEKEYNRVEESGITIAVQNFNSKYSCDEIINLATSLEFKREQAVNGGTQKIYNAIIATFANGVKQVACTLVANEYAKQFLEAASDLGLLTSDIISIYNTTYVDANHPENEEKTIGCVYFAGIMENEEIILEKAAIKRAEKRASKSNKRQATNKNYSSLAKDIANGTVENLSIQEDNTTSSYQIPAQGEIGEVNDGLAPSFTA